MIGPMMAKGMRSSAANSGTVASTRITPTTFGTYMLAISPQTKSGLVANSIGPGVSPQIISPPIITAALAEDGTPSASIGSIAQVPALWSAASGATMPSSWPVPKGRPPLRDACRAMP